MKTVGLILNPSARKNKRQTQNKIDTFQSMFGDRGVVYVTSESSEVGDAIEKLRRDGVRVLCVSGGDGTLSTVLTTYINSYGDRELPLVVPLKGGTINMIGAEFGLWQDQVKVLKKLLGYIDDDKPIPYKSKRLITVSDDQLSDPIHAFTYIDGLMFRFMNEYYTQGAGHEVATMLALKYVGLAVSNPDHKIFREVDSSVYVDGKEIQKDGHVLIIASVLDKFVFGFDIFTSHDLGDKGFHFVYMRHPYLKKYRYKIPLGLYKGLKSDADGDFLNTHTESLRIERNTGYIVDGEIYNTDTERSIELVLGPKVNIFSVKSTEYYKLDS